MSDRYEAALQELVFAIDLAEGQFSPMLVRCEYDALRDRLVQRLQAHCPHLHHLTLPPTTTQVYTYILQQTRQHLDEGGDRLVALSVAGLEDLDNLHRALSSLNLTREQFRSQCPYAVIFWVNGEVARTFSRLAPDFESWSSRMAFDIAPEELAAIVEGKAEDFFNYRLTLTVGDSTEILAIEPSFFTDPLADQFPDQPRAATLTANLQALLGYVRDLQGDPAAALPHYQQSLATWEQQQDWQRQGRLLARLAVCQHQQARACEDREDPIWATTQQTVDRCLQAYDRAGERSPMVLEEVGTILVDLQDWQRLEALARQAVTVWEAADKADPLARACGWLAEVALARDNLKAAEDWVQRALARTSDDCDRSRYHFLLALVRQRQGRIPAALESLEAAKAVGIPARDLSLHLHILRLLRQLYYQQGAYLRAFKTRQERRSIEQQFGLRAFIGAGRLQPRQQRYTPLARATDRTTGRATGRAKMTPEIAASGRQLDVERLLERVGSTASKLTVIHGQSGVGKSSLVTAGLVPTLADTSFGTSDVLPVVLRAYGQWAQGLAAALGTALEQRQFPHDLSVYLSVHSPVDASPASDTEMETNRGEAIAAIAAELERSAQRNLLVVLVFDQFEEFFFACPHPREQRRFFQCLGQWLNHPEVNVILSLREDYLHYLLVGNRLPEMNVISNDILSRQVLYPLGNFSPADARTVVERLTAGTGVALEPALVEQLVADLAAELGEVRPIELQVVGAQLQAEGITTLERYRAAGTKEALVQGYLNEVVKDCGKENREAAELVLYLLTDEQGTRPLKTRSELEADLKALEKVVELDLVLEVLVGWGLVVLVPESPADRYQLVHDYIAEFVRRQQEPRLRQVLAAFREERKQRQQAEAEKQVLQVANRKAERRVLAGSAVMVVMLILAVVVGVRTQRQVEIAREEARGIQEVASRTVDEAENERRTALQDVRVSKRQAEIAEGRAKNAFLEVGKVRNDEKRALARVEEAEERVEIVARREVDASRRVKEMDKELEKANRRIETADRKVAGASTQLKQARQRRTQTLKDLQEAEEQLQFVQAEREQLIYEAQQIENRLEQLRVDLDIAQEDLQETLEAQSGLLLIREKLAEDFSDSLRRIERQTGQKQAIIYAAPVLEEKLLVAMITVNGWESPYTTESEELIRVRDDLQSIIGYIDDIARRPSFTLSEIRPSSNKLYKILIEPFKSELEEHGVEQITFLVDASLRSIPFALLYDSDDKFLLIEKYSIGVMPGLSLTDTRYSNLEHSHVLAVGNRTPKYSYDPTWELERIMEIRQGRKLLNELATVDNIKERKPEEEIGFVKQFVSVEKVRLETSLQTQ